MERREFEERPEDLERVADWLRAQRPEVTALELDRIKQRALAQARREERRGAGVGRPRRSLGTAFTVVLLTISLGGALAIAGQGPPFSSSSPSSNDSAAFAQYCPPGKAGKKCRKEREKACFKQAELEKKAFEQQQRQEKTDFEEQQKQAKTDFYATNPTREQKRAFEQQRKQERNDFYEEYHQKRADFYEEYKEKKQACKEGAED